MDGEKSKKIADLLADAKAVAKRYRDLMKRPLGITGEVAEFEVARLLGYELCEARQAGYDAVSKDGDRIQIKGRCLPDGDLRGRIGAIDLKKDWDRVALVILDGDMEPLVIWEANREAVREALTRPGSKARNVRGQLPVTRFKAIAKEVWKQKGAEPAGR
jgi:hypothetical protein